MKTSSSELYDLIRVLSKSEKRYFKLFSAFHHNHNEKEYLNLFRAYEKASGFNEEKIKGRFSKRSNITYFSKSKNYLYHQLLAALQAYNSESSHEFVLSNLLQQVRLLYNKGLYKHCSKLLKKAQRLAELNHSYQYLFNIYEWRLLLFHNDLLSVKQSEKLREVRLEVLEKIRCETIYRDLLAKISSWTDIYGTPANEKEIARFRPIISHPLMKDPKQATTYISRSSYLQIMQFYHFLNNDYKQLLRYSEQLVNYVEEWPHRIRHNPLYYVSITDNLMAGAIAQRELGIFLEARRKLISCRERYGLSSTRSLEATLSFYLCLSQVTLLNETGYSEKNLEKAEGILQVMKKHEAIISERKKAELQYQLAVMYFSQGENKNALKYLLEIMKDETSVINADFRFAARMLFLVIHFELGNDDMLGYYLHSTYRYLLKKGKLSRFDKLLLKLIKNDLPKVRSRKDLNQLLERSHKELQLILKNRFEKRQTGLQEISTWLESKLKGKSFNEVLRERNPGDWAQMDLVLL